MKKLALKFNVLYILFLLTFIFINKEIIAEDTSQNVESDIEGEKEAIIFIQSIADSVLKIVTAKESDNVKYENLQDLFLKSVDINWMAKSAISKNWKNLSQQEQNEYLNAYKKYILHTYIPKFKQYNGQSFKMGSAKTMAPGKYIVSTQIMDSDSSDGVQNINISYRCKKLSTGQIMIIDIVAENVSLLISQRSEFSSIISNSKDGVQSLIKIMNEKTNSKA